MYVRDQAYLKWPSFWLNGYRLAVHFGVVSFFVLLTSLALIHLTGWQHPVILHSVRIGLVAMMLVWPAVVVAPLVFQFLVKCPCCGSNFASGFFGIYFPGRSCQNCGYDVRTRMRTGDF